MRTTCPTAEAHISLTHLDLTQGGPRKAPPWPLNTTVWLTQCQTAKGLTSRIPCPCTAWSIRTGRIELAPTFRIARNPLAPLRISCRITKTPSQSTPVSFADRPIFRKLVQNITFDEEELCCNNIILLKVTMEATPETANTILQQYQACPVSTQLYLIQWDTRAKCKGHVMYGYPQNWT